MRRRRLRFLKAVLSHHTIKEEKVGILQTVDAGLFCKEIGQRIDRGH
jgi:hypothetical protein